MKKRLLSFVQWVLGRWRRPAPESAITVSAAPEPAAPSAPETVGALALQPEISEAASYEYDAGPVDHDSVERIADDLVWHFRSTILDRLREHFASLDRLRRHDRAAHDLFSQTGFVITSDRYVNGQSAQNLALLRTCERPGFGGVLFGGMHKVQQVLDYVPSFAYFNKLEHAPHHVEPFTDGDVYAFTMLYDDRCRLGGAGLRASDSFPVRCYIGLGRDGSMRVLREWTVRHLTKQCGSGRHRQAIVFAQRRFIRPRWTRVIPQSERKEGGADWTEDIFAMAFLSYLGATQRILIRVQRERAVATFGIALARAKYFFADRSPADAEHRRQRIFHSVIEHERRLPNGQTTLVRHHYRGVRRFNWQGYAIHIVLPANSSVARIAIPAVPDIPNEEIATGGYISEREYGAFVAEEFAE